jgi:hypothetical protein
MSAQNTAIEVIFNPTADDYTLAQRWIARRAMGGWYRAYIVSLLTCAIGLAFGFILLVDGAFAYGKGPLYEQALLGSAVFLIAGYLLVFIVGYTRRKLNQMIMQPGGYFLAQRTMTFAADGINNRGGIVEMQIPWLQLQGVEEDRTHIYLPLERAYALFIPKRVMANPDDQEQLKAFIREKLSKSATSV